MHRRARPKTPPHSQALLAAYAQHDHQVRLQYVRLSLLLFLPLVLIFSLLDATIYPEHFVDMLVIRLAVSATFIAIFALTYSILERHIQSTGVVAAMLAVTAIAVMVAISEGADSPYYAGLNLILVVMSVLLPWTLRETAIVCGFAIAAYLLASAWSAPGIIVDEHEIPEFVNNMFFLIATSIICLTASHFQSRRRFEEFRLRYELDRQNHKLASLDRKKTEFFANVSHELRTPLTLILAPVQDLLNDSEPLAERLARPLTLVRDNALRLLKLVNDLLDVIRMEESKEALRARPLDLNAVAGSVAESMAHLARAKQLTLEGRLPSTPLMVLGDLPAIEKVLINLLSNAIKFTPPQGRVRITSEVDRGMAALSVSDTGIGIPPEERAAIFDRFHQIDGTSTRRYRGSGLGLALAKELIERMSGEIAVASSPGAGTTMTLRLPLSNAADAASEEPAAPAPDGLLTLYRQADLFGIQVPAQNGEGSADVSRAPSPARPSLLLVEDEPDMRRYLTALLAEDYHVLLAETGTEGLRRAREDTPELVLLDLMLPEMDGLEVCRALRQTPPVPSQKIMLLTARVDEASKIAALEEGADDFLTKPFSSVEVRTRLRNLLAQARLERALAERNERLQRALEDLRQTQAMLVHSEKLAALGTLAAGLLHEVNNPLNYSLTGLQVLARQPPVRTDPRLREIVADIDEGMQRIQAIVSDLRAFAHPSAADTHARLDLAEALTTALRFTAHELRGVEVVKDLAPEPWVLASRGHIVQVLVNLLTNAAKAIAAQPRAGGGQVRISAAREGDRMVVRVADNGVGMEPDTLKRAFDPFYTTREVGAGMGLGLSICHTIVANHGGRLSAQSRPAEGSEFRFDLPLAPSQ